ncbi:MAG: hypothetical protein HWD60_17230 [Defluviicoccus sp.]|nr:MAG: hypothetical protein HWD60_17230 [Defluviicoccus sp.]
MRQESADRPGQSRPDVCRSIRVHHLREDAGAADTRQAWLIPLLLTAVLSGLAGGECRAADGTPQAMPDARSAGGSEEAPAADAPAVPPAPTRGDRQHELLDEERRVRGRLQTLDRQLEPYERDRLRARPTDPQTGRPSNSRRDPVSERRELQRRNLQFRQRQIESELRRNTDRTSR